MNNTTKLQILVLIEQRGGEIVKSSLETLGEALDMAEAAGEALSEVTALLLLGETELNIYQKLVTEISQFGPSRIIIARHAALTNFDAAAWSEAVVQVTSNEDNSEVGSIKSEASTGNRQPTADNFSNNQQLTTNNSVPADNRQPTTDNSVPTPSSVLSPPSLFMLSATPYGRELAPQLAVKLNAGLVADSVRVRLEAGKIEATVPLFGDRVYSQQQINGSQAVVSFRPGARGLDKPGERGERSPEVIELKLANLKVGTEHLGFVAADPRTVTLPEAERIVCGGAGVGQEQFDLMWKLADEVGAAVGGTRVAVDKGWLEWDRQIGQTGQVVAPRLFISCGTSGAGQHITGMKDSRTVVVINSDRNAPMFSLADIGVVGDVHEIIPLLLSKLRQYHAEATFAHAVALVEKEEALTEL